MSETQRKPDGTFVPGHAPTRGVGRPPLPKELRKYSAELRSCIINTFKKDVTYFREIETHPERYSLLEITVAKHIQQAAMGSVSHFQLLLDRTIGRIKEAPPDKDEDIVDKSVVLDMIPREKLLELIEDKK